MGVPPSKALALTAVYTPAIVLQVGTRIFLAPRDEPRQALFNYRLLLSLQLLEHPDLDVASARQEHLFTLLEPHKIPFEGEITWNLG